MTFSDPAISLENCTRRFGSLTAVDHLNLSIGRGEIFGLVGPDGAGKTTTLRMICSLLEPSEGQVHVAGYDARREVLAVKDRIGYMAQKFGMYLDLTVEENLFFYADLFGISVSRRNELMQQLLRMTRMGPFRHRQARRLSGGMRQKLALMCSLLHRPEILILDEPTNGVDPVSRRDFWTILYQLVKDGLTVLVTTAYLDEAERCNRVGLMFHGRLIRCDSPTRLKETTVGQCYAVVTENPRRAREILEAAPGVVSVEPSGARLHLFLTPGQTSVERLSSALAERGLGRPAFNPIVPSLEDVFIAEVRKAGQK
jgi:ABC-2 type transport system ATP-binding protein